MAKRKAAAKGGARNTARKTSGTRKSVSRPKARKPRRTTVAKKNTRAARKSSTARRTRKASPAARTTPRPSGSAPRAGKRTKNKASAVDRERRRLEETVQTPPSSLDMNRRGTAARSGRHEMAENLEEHAGMTAVTGGDVDADFETAYFSGDETPGGDNPTPDQDIVDDIGKSIGVEYQDNEELKSTDKVSERDKHRWELDPASSEDYKERE